MSDRIKIRDLPGLLQYGTALNSYGDNVEAAAKDTERIFKDKSDERINGCTCFFLKD